MSLDFYHGHGSPYSWRVWLALEHLGVPYELRVLSFSEKDTTKPQFLAINPRHRVPTIVDERCVVWESMAILEYLDERYGGKARLYPGSAQDRARIRRLCLEFNEYVDEKGLTLVYDEYFTKGDAPPDPEKVAQGRATMKRELEFFAGELQGDWFGKPGPTAADFVMYPIIGYMKRITVRKPETKLVELMPPPVAAWAARVEALPYFGKTFPPHWK